MPLSIKDPETERLARELANETGETITRAVSRAVQRELLRVRGRKSEHDLVERIMEIGRHCASLPDLDTRTPDDIIGYDEIGVPR